MDQTVGRVKEQNLGDKDSLSESEGIRESAGGCTPHFTSLKSVVLVALRMGITDWGTSVIRAGSES